MKRAPPVRYRTRVVCWCDPLLELLSRVLHNSVTPVVLFSMIFDAAICDNKQNLRQAKIENGAADLPRGTDAILARKSGTSVHAEHTRVSSGTISHDHRGVNGPATLAGLLGRRSLHRPTDTASRPAGRADGRVRSTVPFSSGETQKPYFLGAICNVSGRIARASPPPGD